MEKKLVSVRKPKVRVLPKPRGGPRAPEGEPLPEPKRGNKCHAHRTNGMPCHMYAIKGGTVCMKHGGSAPQVKMNAQQRIREAADPAAAKIVQIMSDPKVPYALQLVAARDLLDRAGISKTQTIGVEVRRYEALIESGVLLMDIEDPQASRVGGKKEKVWDGDSDDERGARSGLVSARTPGRRRTDQLEDLADEAPVSISDRDWEVRVEGPVPVKTVAQKRRYRSDQT